MTLPPDRSHVRTEHRHPASGRFDALSTLEQVAAMAEDHEAAVEAVAAAGPALAAFIDALVPRLAAGGRLVYAGAGTSGRLGVLDASECPPTFQSDPAQIVGIIAGGDSALRRSSEAKEDDPDGILPEFARLALGAGDTLVGIAAGGTTPYVLGAIAHAKRAGALTAFLTCAPHAKAEGCDHHLLLDTGPEILTGSTRLKAGTATKLALNTITTVAFTRLGKVYGNLMVDLAATNAKLVDRAIRTLRFVEPTLSREDAHALLESAGRSVKVAVVMRRRDLDRGAAERLLASHAGHLRAALG